MNLFARVWNMSPASFCRGVKKRVAERKRGSRWATIRDGALKGHELYLPPSGSVWEEMTAGFYDEFLYEALKPIKPIQGSTVWDVGAHVGYHSLGFAARGANVVAFEPNSANLERLEMNVRRNATFAPHIRMVPVALSDADGEMIFKQSGDLRGQSMGGHLETALPPLTAADYAGFRAAIVQTAKMDTLVNGRGEKAPDIIKIDVEGAEELVLRGGSAVLQKHHPVLLVEVHHICLMYSVQKLLTSWNYSIEILDREHASASRCFIIAYSKP